MTTAPLPAAAIGLPFTNTGRTHALAKALDDYLRLTDPEHDRRRLLEDYLANPEEPGMSPAMSSLQRLRFEAEQEVERLIALLDLLDGDPDLEPSLCGVLCCSKGLRDTVENDECEECCEDEGAQCDDEGDCGDTGIADIDGLIEQRPFCVGFSEYTGAA